MAGNGSTYRYIAYRRRRRNGNHKGMPRWMMIVLGLFLFLLVGAGVMAGVGFGVYNSYANDLIPPDEAIAQQPRGGARILDRDGTLLFQIVDDASGLRDPVPIDEISLYLIAATIAAEDASFMDNPGVNFKGLAAAAWDNFSPFGDTPGFLEGRGGSSITQQLVKNVYFSFEERQERSAERKLKETIYALELTRQYEKEQILEWYLNQISYGNVFVGIGAAAKGYFGKDASELTLPEAALLAGIPSCPSCYDPINEPEEAIAQRNRVLKRMWDEEYIADPDQFWSAAASPLELAPQGFPIEAPHFVFNVVKPELERLFGEEAVRRDGLVVYTTLDLDVQRQAESILEQWITEFESSGGHNGAVVAIDPKTAEIVVYVGSRDFFREDIDGENDMAAALNSPGSSFKPFTYLTSFMELGWGPGTMVLDTPLNTKWWDGENPPRNPGTGFQGPITVRNSLGSSLNIPAVKTILYTGVVPVIEQARRMGITSLDDPTRYGPSLTVGGVDVRLIDMVYGYTAFPNLGIQKGLETTVEREEGNRALDPISIVRVEDREGNVLWPIIDGQPAERPVPHEVRVAPAPESFMINDILSDGCAQTITFGACGALSIAGRPFAVKTGTSEPYEQIGLIGDTWAIGYTPQLVVGSWFGNADNAPMTNILSTSVSWRTVRDFATVYHEGLPLETFSRPEGLSRASACMPSGLRPTPNCGQTTPDDYFATASLPAEPDTWWTTGRIDSRTGQPATDNTPQQFVVTSRTLRLPATLGEWQREQALEWARALGSNREEDDDEEDHQNVSPVPIAITSPANAAPIQNVVTITGRANSPSFQSYRLEFQSAGGPWTLITQSSTPVADGILGDWNTTTLTPGIYTLRLVVVDAQLGEIITRIDVLVLSSGLPPPTPTPELPEPTAPAETQRGRGPPAHAGR